MTVNEESRQIAIADQLAETAKQLAHSIKAIPKSSDSYALFGDLVSAQESLADVYTQLVVCLSFDWLFGVRHVRGRLFRGCCLRLRSRPVAWVHRCGRRGSPRLRL